MRFHSKKIIELDPNYENGAGYFLLGAVHYKSPYVPFILSWPSNKDAIMWLQRAYDTGEAEIAQVVYLAQALNCLLYTSPSPRDQRGSRMPSSA